MNLITDFKFFHGITEKTITYYSSWTNATYWDEVADMQRQYAEIRLRVQREQTNRMRQFGSTRRTGRNYISNLRSR